MSLPFEGLSRMHNIYFFYFQNWDLVCLYFEINATTSSWLCGIFLFFWVAILVFSSCYVHIFDIAMWPLLSCSRIHVSGDSWTNYVWGWVARLHYHRPWAGSSLYCVLCSPLVAGLRRWGRGKKKRQIIIIL